VFAVWWAFGVLAGLQWCCLRSTRLHSSARALHTQPKPSVNSNTTTNLTPTNQQAAELAEDMRTRRRRSFAAVVGRLRIQSPEQEAALLAPSAAARILDLLLSLPTQQEREELLPDCFTPPPAENEQPASTSSSSGGDSSSSGGGGRSSSGGGGSGVVEGEETDELWCTPLQLLNEIDARAQEVEQSGRAANVGGGEGGGAPSQRPQQQMLGGGGQGLTGEAYFAALSHLREAVSVRWMESLPRTGGNSDA